MAFWLVSSDTFPCGNRPKNLLSTNPQASSQRGKKRCPAVSMNDNPSRLPTFPGGVRNSVRRYALEQIHQPSLPPERLGADPTAG